MLSINFFLIYARPGMRVLTFMYKKKFDWRNLKYDLKYNQIVWWNMYDP